MSRGAGRTWEKGSVAKAEIVGHIPPPTSPRYNVPPGSGTRAAGKLCIVGLHV